VTCSTIYIFTGPDQYYLVPLLLLGAFYGYSSVVLCNWISTPVLFPVIFSSTAIGICNVLARLATILAPQVAELEQPLPMIIISVMGSVSAFGALLFSPYKPPEVKALLEQHH
jgi:hypothetical protein